MSETPTGRQRHRALARWLRRPLLVLQVEITRTVGPSLDMDGFGQVETIPGTTYTYWRDARIEDVTDAPRA